MFSLQGGSMSFKLRVRVLFFCTIFAIIALTASLIAIFANNNLLVKTNVSVSYTAPDLSEAYVATNVWKCGETEKTPVLATTNIKEVTAASSITESLTSKVSYMVFEFVVENRSQSDKYYVQTTFKDTKVSNIRLEYCAVSEAPIEPENILTSNLTTIEYYYYASATRLVNNIELNAANLCYVYAVVSVVDILFDASFTGNFSCNVSFDPFDERPQLNVQQNDSYQYYLEMGEIPQSYAGTDGTAYTLSEEIYTECGVNYEVYTDASGNKYAKKDGAYYKFEPIRWIISGYASIANNRPITAPNNSFTSDQYSRRIVTKLFITTEKILFNSAWNSTLSRVNYPNSTIYANLTEFYNNILKQYENIVDDYTAQYNLAETKVQTSLADSTTGGEYSTMLQKVFIPNTTLAKTKYFMSDSTKRTAYYTDWALGSDTLTNGKWWTSTNQYNNTDGEIFVANAVDETGNFVATNINEVCGVRPTMVITLPNA